MIFHSNPEKLATHNKVVKRQWFYSTGQLYSEEYCLNGVRHNPNGPAIREWYASGQLLCEYYYLNGNLHNPNGPAVRHWYQNGGLTCEYYYLNGESRNPKGGPAIREWEPDGTLRGGWWESVRVATLMTN